MSRPRRKRHIFRPPLVNGFTPYGSSAPPTGMLTILLEEYEALRLADYEGMSQLEAAERMGVSRPTFTRIYEQAKRKMVQALVEGLKFQISGGHTQFDTTWFRCEECNTAFAPAEDAMYVVDCPVCRGNHIYRLGGDTPVTNAGLAPRPALHQTGYCQCPRCGLKISHQAGVQCGSLICSGCGSNMIREHRPM